MIDAPIVDAVAQAAPDAISTVGTALTTSGGAMALLLLFLRGKFDSLSLLWKKLDELRDRVTADRLSDAKEYATRAELTHVIEKLESHLDQRFNALEKKIDDFKRNQ